MQPTATIDVSIVVVSYNTRDLTIECLQSVERETRTTTFELHVVDNASTDGSAATLQAWGARLNFTPVTQNLGFAGANNVAAKSARGEFILLLNPDTIVLDGAIDKLMAFARETPDSGIWGGRTLFPDGTLNPSSCWGRMTPWNLICRATGLTGLFSNSELFNGEAYGGWQRDTVAHVDIVSGCFLLIRRSLWEALGGFDPAFFMYGEEADLCLRARKLGAAPLITPTATIIHLGGASERTRTEKMVKLLAAKTMLIQRHWYPVMQPLGVALMTAWPLSRWLALSLLSKVQSNAARTDAAATWHAIWLQRSTWLRGYGQRPKRTATSPLASINH